MVQILIAHFGNGINSNKILSPLSDLRYFYTAVMKENEFTTCDTFGHYSLIP